MSEGLWFGQWPKVNADVFPNSHLWLRGWCCDNQWWEKYSSVFGIASTMEGLWTFPHLNTVWMRLNWASQRKEMKIMEWKPAKSNPVFGQELPKIMKIYMALINMKVCSFSRIFSDKVQGKRYNGSLLLTFISKVGANTFGFNEHHSRRWKWFPHLDTVSHLWLLPMEFLNRSCHFLVHNYLIKIRI